MENTKPYDGLMYVGDGASLTGVPARNLNADEVRQFGRSFLLSTGLYKAFAPAYAQKPQKSAIKNTGLEADENGTEDQP